MKFQLTEKEKLLLANHLPNTFVAFIEGFINKMNAYLIEEFKHPPFQEAYLSELFELKKEVERYLYDSELAYSWINLEKYTYEDLDVSPEEAYTRLGYLTADFQTKVNELVLKHFPENNIQKVNSEKEQPKKEKEKIPKKRQKKLEPTKTDQKEPKPKKAQNSTGNEVSKKKQQKAPAKKIEGKTVLNEVKEELNKLPKSKGLPTDIPKQKEMNERLRPMEVAKANYEREYKRYLLIYSSHSIFIQMLTKRKERVITKLQDERGNNHLIELINKELSLKPLPQMDKKKYRSIKEYEQATNTLFTYTSHYAKLSATLVTNVMKWKESDLPTIVTKFTQEVVQLMNDYLARFSFYLIPSKKYSSQEFFNIKGRKSTKYRLLFGIVLEEERNGEDIKEIVEKGTFEYY